MAKTVGELKKLLDSYPDDLCIAYVSRGNYTDDITIRECVVLGKFQNPVNNRMGYPPYYRKRKVYDSETWIEDVEVLVLE